MDPAAKCTASGDHLGKTACDQDRFSARASYRGVFLISITRCGNTALVHATRLSHGGGAGEADQGAQVEVKVYDPATGFSTVKNSKLIGPAMKVCSPLSRKLFRRDDGCLRSANGLIKHVFPVPGLYILVSQGGGYHVRLR